MEMKISGSGKIPAGEYSNIRISGSGEMYGVVQCHSFQSSGSAKGEQLICAGELKVSGSGSFSGNVSANNVAVSGSVSCNDMTAGDEISVSGSLRAKTVTAKSVTVNGAVNCDEHLRADNISITYGGKMSIGSIVGGKICMRKSRSCLMVGNVTVATSIEGDEVALERVTCPRVMGRVVRIGKGCHVDLVQYSEGLEISRMSKVKHTEKI